MGLLEEIFARSQMPANPALYHQNPPELESILETLARGPEETTRRVKNPFPAVVAPPAPVVAAPIQQMAQQAGILAPEAGRLGLPMPAQEADPAPMGGTIPMPVPRPPIDANAEAGPADVPVNHGGGGRPTSLITPSQREALHEAAPTLAPAPTTAMPSQSPFGGSSLLDRLTTGLGDHSNTLLALAAGFAGAPTIGQGISRAAAAAIPARAADIREQMTRRGMTTSLRALLSAGVPMQLAVAAQTNPSIMKAVEEKYLTRQKAEVKEIHSEDAFGNKSTRLVAVNPYDLTTRDITGGGGGGGTAAEGSTAGPTLYAPGVSQVDSTKVGDEYLSQFSPEVQAGVKNYINGSSLPTGRQKLAQTIKTIAQKYGEDTGIPVNDQLYGARKAFQTSLGDTKNGVGAQVKGFQQGLEHAVELSDNLVKLGNSSGLGFEDVAAGVNWMKNRTVGAQDIVRHIQNSSQALAGEVGKLYSGGTGGGVHERDATKKLLGDPNMSGPAAAGALESTIELMEGGLRTLERRRDELFPHGKPAGGDFRSKAEEAAIEHIKKNIAILRGEQAREEKAAAAAKPKVLPPGAYVWTPDGGVRPR